MALAFLCLLSSLQITSAQSKVLGLPFSYHIDPAEYSAGMQNLDTEQDSRGFMYFANNFGLLEFDGAYGLVFLKTKQNHR